MDERMSRLSFSDETLMAYADGQLDEKVAGALEQAMLNDPTLVAQVVAYIRSRHLAREAFGANTSPSVPPRLEAAVRKAIAEPEVQPKPATASGERSGEQERFRTSDPGPERKPPPKSIGRMAALAASVALVIGAAAGFGAQRLLSLEEPAGTQGLLAKLEQPSVLSNLDHLPSGAEQSTPAGTVRAIASFKRPSGELCREFRVADDARRSDAIACRDAGKWTITFAALDTGNPEDYVPAAEDDPVDAYLRKAGLGEPLDAAAEQAVLRR